MRTLLVILFISVLHLAYAQQTPIPIYQSEHISTPFINEEGKTVFTLPKGHEPVTQLTSLFKKPPVYKKLEAFPSGICVVQGPNHHFYWIDASSKILKDFGKGYYYRMSPFVEQFAIGMTIGQNRNQIFNYLNTSGVPLHSSGFEAAHPFSEGLAACQMLNKEFVYIDQTGKVVLEPFKGWHVEFAELGQFINGLAPIKAKIGNKYLNYIIDRKGGVAIDLNKVFPDRRIAEAGNFFDELAAILLESDYGAGTDLAFIDKTGVVRLMYTKVAGFHDFIDGLACVHREEPTEDNEIARHTTLINTLGKEVKLQTTRSTYITTITPTYIAATVFDGTRKTIFFSRMNKAPVFEAEGEVAGMNGDFVLMRIGDYDPIQHIIKLPNSVVWTPRPEHIVYDNISEAMKVRDEVLNLELGTTETINASVYEFKKLENLELSLQDITTFPPGINRLENLQRLRLFRLEMLTALPTELTQLKKIKTIEIVDCPRLKNIETVIEKCSSLRTVKVENYTFRKGFIDNMKKQRPELVIEATSTIQFGDVPIR